MSQLIFIRHGQASLFADDYDQLSPLGERQAALLGDYWLANEVYPTDVYCGPRRRHLGTCDTVRKQFIESGRIFPGACQLDGLDEHHVDQLVMNHLDEVVRGTPPLQKLAKALEQARDAHEKERRFQRLFESVARKWAEGHGLGVESWSEFQERVNHAIDQIVSQTASGSAVAVFTSAGPISVAMKRALGCSGQVALETGWRQWNCSLTRFVFSGDRFTLDGFNELPHLPRAEWTYR